MKQALFWFCLVTVILAIVYGIIRISENHQARIDESWRQFDQRLIQAGCKVTGYVPGMSGWVRPMWTCPDGHVQIGQPQ